MFAFGVLNPLAPQTQRSAQLMQRFAEDNGLINSVAGLRVAAPPEDGRRSLWTDAFAVCNFLGLGQSTGEVRYLEWATRLVGAVHTTLGKHRSDDLSKGRGWLSELSDLGAAAHPTWGGLRIGNRLPERTWDEPLDERLEGERDGQYFHHLTKWMHALDQLARATHQFKYNRWARELAAVAYAAFGVQPTSAGPRRLVRKMSVDLSRSLVVSMGQHDALDGFITCVQLQATAARGAEGEAEGPNLQEERHGLEAMTEGADWTTTDPLGLGLLLADTFRVARLEREGARFPERLFPGMLEAGLEGLQRCAQPSELPQLRRLRPPFGELGLAIGLQALEGLVNLGEAEPGPRGAGPWARLGDALPVARSLGAEIDTFWLDREPREEDSRDGHRDLNQVLLATRLCPRGYLELFGNQPLVLKR